MRLLALSALLILFLGCASVAPHTPFRFSDIEALEYGKSDSSELKRLFGQPHLVVHLDSETDVWSYNESIPSGELLQRLSFSVSRKDEKVVSGIWLMSESDVLYRRDAVFNHFKSSKFTHELEGKVAPDYYSSDLIYSDIKHGIIFHFGVVHQSIQYIAFSEPNGLPIQRATWKKIK